MEKVCKKCGNMLSINSFYKRKDYKDGYSVLCKKCEREKIKEIEKTCLVCGRVFSVSRSRAKQGKGKYCSDSCKNSIWQERLNSEIGKRYGNLVVKDFSHEKRRKDHIDKFFNCLCDCGNFTVVNIGKLRNKHTVSCGCLSSKLVTERNKDNNRIEHVATKKLSRNTPNSNNITTGIKNVYLNKAGTFRVTFKYKQRTVRIGTYKTLAEAKFIADSCRDKISEVVKEYFDYNNSEQKIVIKELKKLLGII